MAPLRTETDFSMTSERERISPRAWPEVRAGLEGEAERLVKHFFRHQQEPLRPLLVLYRSEDGGVLRERMLLEDPDQELAKRALGMLWAEATREGSPFLGAMEVSEIRFGSPEEAEASRPQGLMVVLGEPGGWRSVTLFPFRRDSRTQRPRSDGFPIPLEEQGRQSVA